MRGEWSGKVRSTPTPWEIRRTVNAARSPPPRRPITVPSNAWRRSRPPSATFMCTRTVSPAANGGSSVFICWRSIATILSITQTPPTDLDFMGAGGASFMLAGALRLAPQAQSRPAGPPAEVTAHYSTRALRASAPFAAPRARLIRRRAPLTEPPAGFLVERGLVHQIGPARERPPQRLAPPPAADLLVMPAQQHLRHGVPFEVGRPGVVRVIEQARRERVLAHRRLLAHHARHETAHGLDDHHRRQFAAAQNVIADADFFRAEDLGDALVHSLVPAAQNGELRRRGEGPDPRLREAPPLRAGQQDRPRRRRGAPDDVHGAEERLGLHHHAGPAAVRRLVHGPVAVVRERAEVPDHQVEQAPRAAAADHPRVERPGKHVRKDRHHVDTHHDHSGGRTTISPAARSTVSITPSTAGSSVSVPAADRTT